ncbi:hypothetical protein [Hyphomonas oceanitis]|uniref:hypothetical protein n=1 Tax=Hyphomonas oceanitis TaxID=81033 RepID=UPI0030012021
MSRVFVPHPQRSEIEKQFDGFGFNERKDVQYGVRARKAGQWFVFYDPDTFNKSQLLFGFEPKFASKNEPMIQSFATEKHSDEASSTAFNVYRNAGSNPAKQSDIAVVWKFSSVVKFLDCVRELERSGALS